MTGQLTPATPRLLLLSDPNSVVTQYERLWVKSRALVIILTFLMTRAPVNYYTALGGIVRKAGTSCAQVRACTNRNHIVHVKETSLCICC